MSRLLLKITTVFLLVILIGWFVNDLMPKDIHNESFYDINPISETEYISDFHKLGKYKVGAYTFLNKTSSNGNKEEFIITIAKQEGLLNNRYSIYAYAPQDDEALIHPNFSNIDRYPLYEIKKGDKYYGFVYAGIVPDECKRLSFNEIKADLKPYSITINGKKADFVFYSCFVEQDVYPETVEIEWN